MTVCVLEMQYVGYYDDDTFGGVTPTIQKLYEADPNFGKYVDINCHS